MSKTAETTVDQSTADGATTDTGTESATVTEGATALGDAGKKALDAMKAERNEAKAEAKRFADEFAALRAQVEGREAEHAATLAAQAVKDEALSAANQRILKAEVRAQAASKLNDPRTRSSTSTCPGSRSARTARSTATPLPPPSTSSAQTSPT